MYIVKITNNHHRLTNRNYINTFINKFVQFNVKQSGRSEIKLKDLTSATE